MMRRELQVTVEGEINTVVVSDDVSVLLAAKAAGGAVLGLYDAEDAENLPFGIPYFLEKGEPITGELLERIVRRQKGLPWRIAETERLLLREFIPEDWEVLRQNDFPAFSDYPEFLSYCSCQYSFYEYGLWAVLEKKEGKLIGAAGIWNPGEEPNADGVELGYWICPKERRKGYGREAVEAVADYAGKHLECPVYMNIREENLPSRRLAERCGFTAAAKQSGSRIIRYQSGPCW